MIIVYLMLSIFIFLFTWPKSTWAEKAWYYETTNVTGIQNNELKLYADFKFKLQSKADDVKLSKGFLGFGDDNLQLLLLTETN